MNGLSRFTGLKIFSIAFLVVFFTACSGNYKSTHHTTGFIGSSDNKAKVFSVDAEQRFGVIDDYGRFCAEPSPDSISALADAFGLNLSEGKSGASGNFSGNSAESVASIGLRTQSIQLMRDAMYRICELSKNEQITETSAYMLHAGYQDVMTALLAIEQLTGPVKAAQAALTSATETDVTQTINDLESLEEKLQKEKDEKTTKKETAVEEKNTAENAKNNSQNTYNSVITKNPDAGDEQVKTAKEDLDEKTAVFEEKKAVVESLTSEIDNIDEQLNLVAETNKSFQKAKASSNSKAELSAAIYQSTINQSTVVKISDTVESIAKEAINRSRATPACLVFMINQSEKMIEERFKLAKGDYSAEDLLRINNDINKANDLFDVMKAMCRDFIAAEFYDKNGTNVSDNTKISNFRFPTSTEFLKQQSLNNITQQKNISSEEKIKLLEEIKKFDDWKN